MIETLTELLNAASSKAEPSNMATANYDPKAAVPWSVSWRVELADGSSGQRSGEGMTAQEAFDNAAAGVELVPSDALIDDAAKEYV